jgi:rod shape-determining protein MreC
MARLMFYILLSVVLMTLDYRGQYVDRFRAWAGLAVEPIFLAIEAPFRLVASARETLVDRSRLRAERDEYERLLRESRARLLVQEHLSRENAQLRELLDAARALETRYHAVELRHIDLNPYSHRVLINRGRRDGLTAAQPVVDAYGVVGQIDEVMQHSAAVILLSDPDHALPVRVERTSLRTIAYGTGRSDRLRLTDLPMNVDLRPSDRLVTSGLGGRFPPGLPVGEVVSVDRPAGRAFASAAVSPLARLDWSRHLLVLASGEDVDGDRAADEGAAAVAGDGSS